VSADWEAPSDVLLTSAKDTLPLTTRTSAVMPRAFGEAKNATTSNTAPARPKRCMMMPAPLAHERQVLTKGDVGSRGPCHARPLSGYGRVHAVMRPDPNPSPSTQGARAMSPPPDALSHVRCSRSVEDVPVYIYCPNRAITSFPLVRN